MAGLPDPTSRLSQEDTAALDHMASVRSGADGRSSLGDVYVRMFNNPAVARAVGALGEQLRFHGVLPDRTRELVILRFAARRRIGYVWAHHQRPASLAGLDQRCVDALREVGVERQEHKENVSDVFSDAEVAVVETVDAVVDELDVPAAVQARVVAAHGEGGIVEIVALCGLYGLIGAMVTSFDISLESGLPPVPF
jgi:4-carboxymuconolactone decarboxylase